MAKVRIGKGWFVLAAIGSVWAVNRYLPQVVQPLKDAVGARVPFLARPTPAPTPLAPSPDPTAPPTPALEPTPQPEFTPEPEPTPIVEATPEPDGAPEPDGKPGAARTGPLPFPESVDSEPQTRTLSPGNGPEAKVGNSVVVTFAADGGLPVDVSFMIGAYEVAPGFDRGVRGMKLGEKRSLRIPESLARGPLPGGAGATDLNCTVELKAIL